VRPAEELKRVEQATVFKSGVPAARLVRRPAGVELSYFEAYLEADRPPVATTLPLSREPVMTHAPGALPPFFSGMLPEGRRLTALRSAAKTSADDEFTLLLVVGNDAVGDVQVVPVGDDPSATEPRVTVSEWGEVRFAEVFRASVGDGATVDRVALAGVQDKISAGMINVPVAVERARFILKLNPPEFPHLVANEAFFLRAARRSGLETVEADVVHDAVGDAGLLVRRFDRVSDAAGHMVALAQEDACQVSARYPADKYRLSTEEALTALAGVCRARPVAALTLIKQIAFAYLSCNGDAHAKNFSVLRVSDEWRVTPAYDLPSSYPYGDTTMALALNGKRKEDIGRSDFVALGETVGVRPRAVEAAVDELCDNVAAWIDDMAMLPFDTGRLTKLRRAIEHRRKRLSGR
jgi:serine/threonine-protein kinase HipA